MELLATRLDACIERYSHLHFSDHMAQSCLADIGVALTIEKGIHQVMRLYEKFHDTIVACTTVYINNVTIL